MAQPLVGYNTNVSHREKVYHIQTEDSGRDHPHIISHLFADGGRIVTTRKKSYADLLDSADVDALVRQMMQKQHRAMCAALEQGRFDAQLDGVAPSSVAPRKESGSFGSSMSMRPSRRSDSASWARHASLDDAILRILDEEEAKSNR